MMKLVNILGICAPLAMVLVLVVPWMARRLTGPCRRLTAYLRHSPVEALGVSLFVLAFVVYGATKSADYRIVAKGYSGVYDGAAHTVSVDVWDHGGWGLDYVAYSENAAGPYVRWSPPSYVNAGTYVVYYSAYKMDDDRVLGSCTVTIRPRQLTQSMVAEIPAQPYVGRPVEPVVSIADGLLTTNDYVVSYSNNVEIGQAMLIVTGTNNYTGRIVRRFPILTPFGGSVVPPGMVKTGQTATWRARPDAGSVFAGWTGPVVDALGLTANERLDPTLRLKIPDDFAPAGVNALFLPVEEDGLHALGLDRTVLNPDEAVMFSLTHDSRSRVSAKVSGLPPGLSFDALRLQVHGTPSRPGIYPVKIVASNASGYCWSESVILRVRDRTAEGFVDFSGLPETVERGVAFSGTLVTDLRGTAKVSGLPPGVVFRPSDGVVFGAPTKAGVFVVEVSQVFPNGIRKRATHTMTVSPWACPEPVRTPYHAVSLLGDPTLGRIVGGGVYPEGRSIQIEAKPVSGMAFAGWYLDGAFSRPLEGASADYRQPRLSVVVDGARRIYARFVPVEQAASSLTVTLSGVSLEEVGHQEIPVGVQQRIPLVADALSAAIVKVSGLPSGLRYDPQSGAIVGVATRVGAAKPVTVKVTVAGQTRTFQLMCSTSALPAWATGTGFLGSGALEGVAGLDVLSVSSTGKISGRLTPISGMAWTLSAVGFREVTSWGAYVADVMLKRQGKNQMATLWIWGEPFGQDHLLGHWEIDGLDGRILGSGWQSAYSRRDLVDIVEPVKDRTWTIETERGPLMFRSGGAKGALQVRGTLDGMAVSASAQLLQIGWNYRGEPDFRTVVRLPVRGKSPGMVWTGSLESEENPGKPALNVVTTTEDVVDATDGKVSLREAFSTSNEIRFDLPSDVEPRIVLSSSLPFQTSKTIDGRLVRRIHGQEVTNRVAISGGGRIRLFAGGGGAVNVTFRNLVLEDGYIGPVGYAPVTCGGVVQAESRGEITFENCLVRNNVVEGNGAVADWRGHATAVNSVFENNHANHMGGVFCLEEGGITARECTFTGNYSGTAGGVFRVDGGCQVDNCRIEDNRCRTGGVYMGKGSYSSSRSVYRGNDCPSFTTYTYLLPGETLPERVIEVIQCEFQGGGVPAAYFRLQSDYRLFFETSCFW